MAFGLFPADGVINYTEGVLGLLRGIGRSDDSPCWVESACRRVEKEISKWAFVLLVMRVASD